MSQTRKSPDTPGRFIRVTADLAERPALQEALRDNRIPRSALTRTGSHRFAPL
jgi:hypothetical protein